MLGRWKFLPSKFIQSFLCRRFYADVFMSSFLKRLFYAEFLWFYFFRADFFIATFVCRLFNAVFFHNDILCQLDFTDIIIRYLTHTWYLIDSKHLGGSLFNASCSYLPCTWRLPLMNNVVAEKQWKQKENIGLNRRAGKIPGI